MSFCSKKNIAFFEPNCLFANCAKFKLGSNLPYIFIFIFYTYFEDFNNGKKKSTRIFLLAFFKVYFNVPIRFLLLPFSTYFLLSFSSTYFLHFQQYYSTLAPLMWRKYVTKKRTTKYVEKSLKMISPTLAFRVGGPF